MRGFLYRHLAFSCALLTALLCCVCTYAFLRLTPAPGTSDADLFFSSRGVSGVPDPWQLSSTAGVGAVDTVTVTQSSPYWLPTGGPYYIRVTGLRCAPTAGCTSPV